ncbi:hypothetical protein LEM8419_01374 [Neolewinella maritima]|uniref:Glycosyltransferase n=1 Tax=Neolewinella maritima TaxID=1383882 RepID=A0ABN8F6H1_9BACT|nr:glycosyltransferase family 4 protein [Neolewinella maritima]CAH1000225.1 hypothetical protein LEM8419_01374 [Neolewinella maritima]
MRIICTVTNDLSHDQRMDRICTTLQAAGHDVLLLGRWLPGSPPLESRTYRTHRLRCRWHSGKRFYLEYTYRLRNYLRQQTAEVICAVDLDTLLAVSFLRSPDTKIVYDAHEWFSETPEVVHRPLIRRIWRTVGRRLVPRTDARYTVGPALAELLEEDYKITFEVIRNVPEQIEYTNKENSEGVILYQGMLNPGRGLATAIEALPLLPSSCKLWIVGSGPELEPLQRIAVEFGVSNRVWFAGFTPPADLPALTAQAWLGLNLLADSSPSYYYSLANKSLDYIQAGLPSVQMDFPEYRAIHVQYDVFSLLPTLSPTALAAVIRELIDQPDRYVQLQANCHAAARDLCWEVEAPKLLKIYSDLARQVTTSPARLPARSD